MRGLTFLPKPVARREDRVVTARHRHDQRGEILGRLAGEMRRVGVQHLRHARDLRGAFAAAPAL